MKLKELKNTGNNKLGRIYNKLMRRLDDEFIARDEWYYMTDEKFENYNDAFNDMELIDILNYFGEKDLLQIRTFGKGSLTILKELAMK